MTQIFSRDTVRIRRLGQCAYLQSWRAMQTFTGDRDIDTVDEIWSLQHEAVITLGQAGKEEHVLAAGEIPVVRVDRGGQATYHGPGQLIVYLMIDLRRRNSGVRQLVTAMEESVIALLAHYEIEAAARSSAPGVYVADAKIASLGLRVRRACAYHGLSLNVSVDRSGFARINPCGYPGLEVVNLSELTPEPNIEEVEQLLLDILIAKLGYSAQCEGPGDLADIKI